VLAFDGRLWVHYSQAYVMSGDASHPGDQLDFAFRGQVNGLLGAALRGVLVLTTGLHTGEVRLRVEVHDGEPPIDESWQEIVEANFAPRPGAVVVRDWNGFSVTQIPVAEGANRIRYCASQMDEARDADTRLSGEEPIDSYRLDFWPSSPRADEVVKQTSDIAAYWHSERAK